MNNSRIKEMIQKYMTVINKASKYYIKSKYEDYYDTYIKIQL